MVRLAFPLQDGLYYVAQGGKSRMMNNHNFMRSQMYALDILRLNFMLLRCWGLWPSVLKRYRIFGSTVASPCDGTVTFVVNNLPDLPPPHADRKHPAGNHVLIQYHDSDVFIALAHLQQGSVTVKEGESVRAGQPIARVGNSGNTTEPHLHIHAKKGGQPDNLLDSEGLPMLFDGRFLIRNDLVRVAIVLSGAAL